MGGGGGVNGAFACVFYYYKIQLVTVYAVPMTIATKALNVTTWKIYYRCRRRMV
jgi:hypothetical protein